MRDNLPMEDLLDRHRVSTPRDFSRPLPRWKGTVAVVVAFFLPFACAHAPVEELPMEVVLSSDDMRALETFYTVGAEGVLGPDFSVVIAAELEKKGYERAVKIEWADFVVGYAVEKDSHGIRMGVLLGFDNRLYADCMQHYVPGESRCTVSPSATKLFLGASRLKDEDADGSAGLRQVLELFPVRTPRP